MAPHTRVKMAIYYLKLNVFILRMSMDNCE